MELCYAPLWTYKTQTRRGGEEKFKPYLAGQGKFEPEVLGFCSQIQVLDPGGLEVKSLLS